MRRPVLIMLVAAAVIVTAPTAGAEPGDMQCGKRGAASKCQKPGHSSLHSEPATQPLMPTGQGLMRPGWMPGYGRGPTLPVID
jgi:hypothetical protein